MEERFQTCFGEAIRARREALGVSQEAMAERVGVHRTYMGSVERGERNVSLRNIVRIAQALGVTVSVLMEDTQARMQSRK